MLRTHGTSRAPCDRETAIRLHRSNSGSICCREWPAPPLSRKGGLSGWRAGATWPSRPGRLSRWLHSTTRPGHFVATSPRQLRFARGSPGPPPRDSLSDPPENIDLRQGQHLALRHARIVPTLRTTTQMASTTQLPSATPWTSTPGRCRSASRHATPCGRLPISASSCRGRHRHTHVAAGASVGGDVTPSAWFMLGWDTMYARSWRMRPAMRRSHCAQRPVG